MPWIRTRPPTKKEMAATRRLYRQRAKFLVDESLGPRVTCVLKGMGWNAIDTSDLGLSGHPDENVFAAARREDRILLTHDADFLDDRRFPPRLNPGLVILPGAKGNAD